MTIRLFYSINDTYPPYRLDLGELVAHSLGELGVSTEWYMAREARPGPGGERSYLGQVAHVPIGWGPSRAGRWASQLCYWLTDGARIVRACVRRFDVIQVRDKYLASAFALLAARLSGRKFVYWCSYPFPEYAIELGRLRGGLGGLLLQLKGRLAAALLYRLVMPHADHCFVQSERMQDDLAQLGVPRNNMTPVPMGVPPRLLQWTQMHRPQVVPGRVLYLGTLSAVRRLDVILRAFAEVRSRYPDASLMVVGDGDYPWERAALQTLATELGLRDSVQFTGFVPMEQAWSLCASAAVCLSPFYPSRILASTSPTKLVEYMALGRPVVCNDYPEQARVMRESGAGLCVEWGVKSFAADARRSM